MPKPVVRSCRVFLPDDEAVAEGSARLTAETSDWDGTTLTAAVIRTLSLLLVTVATPDAERAVRDFLTEIENDLLDDLPLATVLRKCILMTGHVDSPRLRAWAEQELNGYAEEDADVPPYRTRRAALKVNAVVGNTTITGQTVSIGLLPDFVKDYLGDGVTFIQGVGELEAMLGDGDGFLQLGVPNFEVIAQAIDEASGQPFQQTHAMYWSVSTSAIAAILDETRTALARVVAELRRAVGPSETLPSAADTERAMSVVVYGAHNTVTLTDTSGTGASTQTVVGDTAGAIDAHPAATVGDGQTASGDGASSTSASPVTLRERVSNWCAGRPAGLARPRPRFAPGSGRSMRVGATAPTARRFDSAVAERWLVHLHHLNLVMSCVRRPVLPRS